jgi:hypothetical protein
MMCNVIIHDYVIAHQVIYILTPDDFTRVDMRLPVLHRELLRALAEMDPSMHADTECAANRHLVRLLCGLVLRLGNEYSVINLIRLHRINPDNIFYDYSASMSL